MKKSDVVSGFFGPTYQQATKSVHPTVGALDDPTSSAKSFIFRKFQSFLSTGPDMGSKAGLLDPLSYNIVVIPFVET